MKYLVLKQIILKPDDWKESDIKTFLQNYEKLIKAYGEDYLKVKGTWEVVEEIDEDSDTENS